MISFYTALIKMLTAFMAVKLVELIQQIAFLVNREKSMIIGDYNALIHSYKIVIQINILIIPIISVICVNKTVKLVINKKRVHLV